MHSIGPQVQTSNEQQAGSPPLVELIRELYEDPPPLKIQLIRQSVNALEHLFETNKRSPVIRANLVAGKIDAPPVLDGVQPDIYVSEGSIDIAILVADKCPFPADDERRQKLESWASQKPSRRKFLIDSLPDVKQGTPEAIYKIASATLEQEEKRFNDIEAKARNFFTSNSVVLGTGSLGIATAFNAWKIDPVWKWWVGGPCLLAVVFGIVASLIFHVVQRTKGWKGRASPHSLLRNYQCHGVDHVYRAAAMVLQGSFESLDQENNSSERVLAVGVWISCVSLIGFFFSLLMVLLGYFRSV